MIKLGLEVMLKVIKFPFRKFSSLLGLSLMVMTLFFYKPINAESIDSHIRGRNYSFEMIQTELINSNNIYANSGVYHVTFELDDNYIGYILPNYTLQYKNYFYGSSSPSWGNSSTSFNRRVFINGSSFSFDVPITWYSNGAFSVNGGSDPYVYDSYTVSSSDVTKTSDIDSIDQIINILTDLYNSQDQVEGLLNNQLTQLQQVVSNTTLANTYLETISKLRQWNIPYESLSFVYYLLYRYEPVNLNNSYFSNYPEFKLSNNQNIYSLFLHGNENVWSNSMDMVIATDINISSSSLLIQNFGIDTSKFQVFNYKYLNFFNNGIFVVRFSVKNISGSNETLTIKNMENRNRTVIPIYAGYTTYSEFISTDFALNYGLSNRLLNDLDIIANGTNQSNSSASSSESTNNSLVQSQNQLFNQENNFNQNMNDSLNQIDTNFSFDSKFGSSFLRSSEWVKTQFDHMTGSTPFGSIMGFSLLLGVGLLLIGKVLG